MAVLRADAQGRRFPHNGTAFTRTAAKGAQLMSQPEPTVDLGYPTPASGGIPAFNSIEEEAAFWDSHDITEFLAESTPVHLTVGRELAGRVTQLTEDEDSVKSAGESGV